jgi:hypothetical protein
LRYSEIKIIVNQTLKPEDMRTDESATHGYMISCIAAYGGESTVQARISGDTQVSNMGRAEAIN